MQGLTMDFPLTLDVILRHAATIHGPREVVSRLPDLSWRRYTYAEMAERARRLAAALGQLGVQRGDRVATLGWNHDRHLEAYFGVPLSGAVLHTLNPRLAAGDLAYIINEAQDRILIVDECLLPIWESVRDQVDIEHVVVSDGAEPDSTGRLSYDRLLAETDSEGFITPDLDERQAAMMCYTSGTTGGPKGVVYSHRAISLHALSATLSCGFELWDSDCVLPVVPMFHVNAWGLPFSAAMIGAKLVLPGPNLDPDVLLEGMQQEGVTFTAGVPTVWRGVLAALDAEPQKYDLSRLRKIVVGGSALPASMIVAFEQRHGIRLVQAWGMTETTPMGTLSNLRLHEQSADMATQYENRARQGTPVPFVEIRARGRDGLTPWDGQSMGELEVRGPWVAAAYYQRPDASDRFTDDGWFRTGDVVTIRADGSMRIEDREKDLIKSGGEWISSVELENRIMAHPAVAEAAVVAISDPKWDERPLAVVVAKSGKAVTQDELREHLRPNVAKWWLPDRFEFVESLPKTSVGKIDKKVIRAQFATEVEAADVQADADDQR